MFREEDQGKLDEKIMQNGIDFVKESEIVRDGFLSKPSKIGNSGSQELTLSYLCDNWKLGVSEKEICGRNLILDKVNYKGKEIVVCENSNYDDKWVERDFMNLNETRGSCSKRELFEEEIERDNRSKKPKLETLNLSLALPDVSLSLVGANPIRPQQQPSQSVKSLGPSANTQTTNSYSHLLSHNPSCSLTFNSTEFDCSVGRDDQIWNCGEGTNGSVHSRFKPVGDGVALLHNGGGVYSLMQGNQGNTLYKATSSDNVSFFPSELPARLRVDTQSGDSRGRNSENLRGLEVVDGGEERKVCRPERIIREIVSESVPIMAQIIQELPEETIESTKESLKNLIQSIENSEELLGLQNRLKRRSDLSKETLLKCQKDQLDILVAVRTGLNTFVSGKTRLPTDELVEIFLFLRCKNVNCKSLLPVDDCDCKICSSNDGFCSSCMCPICLKFDCASNTCSWVGCDVCSHWCHAACGIQRNLIKPGPSLKGQSRISEMQHHCIGCNHASEMFGFVKDVFVCCAKDWGVETLKKELDCVSKIFRESEDFKGRELHITADEILCKLESKTISSLDACSFIIQFFNYADSLPEFPALSLPSKGSMATQASLRRDAVPPFPPPRTSLPPPKYTACNTSSSSIQRDLLSNNLRQANLKAEDDLWFGKLSKNVDSLESIMQIKEAEARMFENKADEALREAESYKRMIRATNEKLEEEYTEKLAKLCLQETEEKRRKKLEELKVLENSHCDYYKMKIRMQAEIAGLLERMEATKQKLV